MSQQPDVTIDAFKARLNKMRLEVKAERVRQLTEQYDEALERANRGEPSSAIGILVTRVRLYSLGVLV